VTDFIDAHADDTAAYDEYCERGGEERDDEPDDAAIAEAARNDNSLGDEPTGEEKP
jgi:hypothetical protein